MTEATQPNNGRAVLLLIGGVPVTLILLATWLWYFVERGDLDLVSILGTANRGTLVEPPRPLAEASMTDSEGVPLELAENEPRWTLIVPASGPACDAACEASLYTTRQIHLAMGKEFNRIQRMYVSDRAPSETSLQVSELSDQHAKPSSFSDYLATEHRGLEVAVVPAATWSELFPERVTDPSTWYLADPAGWIMMSYNSDISYKDVMADLKFLLKNSGG